MKLSEANASVVLNALYTRYLPGELIQNRLIIISSMNQGKTEIEYNYLIM